MRTPPARALEQVLALRIHLDDSNADNGPLRVLPASHATGVLKDSEIDDLVQRTEASVCTVPKGGAMAMKPLIVHSSSKCESPSPRRVIHIEYAGPLHFENGIEIAIV